MELDEPYTSQSFMGEDFFASRFYKEWVAPSGYHDTALTILAKGSSRFAAITLPRLADRGQFATDDLARMRLLAPHIRRSVTITDLLDAKALRDDMLSATLDLLVVGVVLVDAEARIVHANRAGARHLDEAQAVRRSDDRLSARDPGAAAALREAVRTATQAGAALMPAKTGIEIPIAGTGGRDLAAWVREIGEVAPLPGELFVRRYGITPAECRVLMLLTQGMSPKEAAEALGCSEATVRTHIQRLLAKTGTGGQPDLMRLAMSALAPAST
jgi:DNA-binding CsgD family transcriptional regulator